MPAVSSIEADGDAPEAVLDRKQVAAIRKQLGYDDGDAVWQGIDLLLAFDSAELWATVAEESFVARDGTIITPFDSEIHKRVRSAFRTSVAVWALVHTGRLADSRHLSLSGYAFADGDFAKTLSALERLDLSNSRALTDLNGLQGLASLSELELSECTSLTALSGLSDLPALTTLALRRCTSLTDLNGIERLPALTRLDLRSSPWLTKDESLSSLSELADGLTILQKW